MGYVYESLMTSFLVVYEFYDVHKIIEMLLQKRSTNTFSALGCFLDFSSFRHKSTQLLWARKNGQDL